MIACGNRASARLDPAMVPDFPATVGGSLDRDHIEAAGTVATPLAQEILLRHAAQLPELAGVDRLLGRPEAGRQAVLDLDEDDRVSV